VPSCQTGQTGRFRWFTLRTLSLKAAWREVERIALGDAAAQRDAAPATPHPGDKATSAATERGASERQAMLRRWQQRAMSPLGSARLVAQHSEISRQLSESSDYCRAIATARCPFSPPRSGSATEMIGSYRAVCPEEPPHVDA
jgi:hypothetical protein